MVLILICWSYMLLTLKQIKPFQVEEKSQQVIPCFFFTKLFLRQYSNYTQFNLSHHLPGIDILLGLFIQHGKLALLFKQLTNFINLCPEQINFKFSTLSEVFLWLWKDITIAFHVKYCMLSRKVRKIVKNKYRYQKRYEWIPPHIRLRTASRFFKHLVLIDQGLSFHQRLSNTITQHLINPEHSNLKQVVHQTQNIAVSVLAQTKRKV